MKNRYEVTHHATATVTFPTMQSAGDFLFSFRNSPDFESYRVTDELTHKIYGVKNDETIDAIEIFEMN